MILDVNVLVIARNSSSPFHSHMRTWLEDALNGPTRVGMPWATLTAFLRLSTARTVFPSPLAPDAAMAQVHAWLAAPASWVPAESPKHAEVLGALIQRHRLTGDLIPDAHLAALAIELGVEVCSTDGDFARFHEIRWTNPLAAA